MEWLIDASQQGKFIRTFLQEIGGFSKRLLIKAKSPEGNIAVNGEKKTVRYMLQTGDVLQVTLPQEVVAERMQTEAIPLDIMYEDDSLMIIDKPAGVATIPSRHHPTGTIANGLLHYYKTKQLPYTVHIVTRLDRDTSGLLLVAKHQYSHSLLAALQKSQQIDRTYLAIVHGNLREAVGRIDAPIGRKAGSIIERIVTPEGQTARTHFEERQQGKDCTLVELTLETGRTHQIRVHMAFLGHPLLGDDLYGGEKHVISRQALHCSRLVFPHPLTGEILRFSSALPREMGACLPMDMKAWGNSI